MKLEDWGLEAPTGDLKRDLTDRRKVLLRRGVGCDEVRAVGDPSDRKIRFIASTDGVKRDGNRVRNDGWDLTNFRKNPAMLWAHDYGSDDRPPAPPIGSWSNEEVIRWQGGDALAMTATFANHRDADVIYNLYLEGHLRAVSIGWTPLEYEPILDEDGRQVGWDMTRNELLECSCVPIPADPDALIVATQRGLIASEDLEKFSRTYGIESSESVYVLDSRDPVEKEPAREMLEDIDRESEDDDGDAPVAALARPGASSILDVISDRIGGGYSAMSAPLKAFQSSVSEIFAEGRSVLPEDDALRSLMRLQALAAVLHADIDEAVDALTLGDDMDEAMLYSSRVGQKISGSRADKLRGVRSGLQESISVLTDVLRDAKLDEKKAAIEVAEFALGNPTPDGQVEEQLIEGLAKLAERQEKKQVAKLEERLAEVTKKLGIDKEGNLVDLLIG